MKALGVNAAFGSGANLSGVRYDPYLAFNFLVEIDGLVVGGCSEVSGLNSEVEVQEVREGGLNSYVHLLPGRVQRVASLVLRHGLTANDALWQWHQELRHGKIERKNGAVHLLDTQRNSVLWWEFHSALPIKWSGPDLRADTATVAFASVELVHQGLVQKRPAT